MIFTFFQKLFTPKICIDEIPKDIYDDVINTEIHPFLKEKDF